MVVIAVAAIVVAVVLVVVLRVSPAAFVPPRRRVARHERPTAIVAIDDGDPLAAQLFWLYDEEVAGPRVLLDQHGIAVRRVGLVHQTSGMAARLKHDGSFQPVAPVNRRWVGRVEFA